MKSVRCSPFQFNELSKLNLLFTFLPIWAFTSPPMIRTLCLGKLRTREDSSSWKAMRSVSMLTLVVRGLPLNVATIILGCSFSMLLSDFWAHV